jgi:6-phosphogluconolactonase
MGMRMATPMAHEFVDSTALADALACHIGQVLTQSIAARGVAVLAVSGGRSPVAWFQCMRRQAVDWQKVHIVWVDERAVALDHADSNAALIEAHLLQGVVQQAVWHRPVAIESMHETPANWHQWQQANERQLQAVPWPMDVAVLGLGLDGHTASIFAQGWGYQEALTAEQHCVWTLPKHMPYARLSLSLSTLLQAKQICVQFSGTDKRAVYAQACARQTRLCAIDHVLHQQRTPVHVWCALDDVP